jgi:hypothetical protein
LVPRLSVSAALIGDFRVSWKLQLPATLFEEWLPVEWLVPAEQTARNPLHKCRSGCTGSAWTSPTPPHPQAGGSQTRSSPLGGRCRLFRVEYRCRYRRSPAHQNSPWTIISSSDRPDYAVVSRFERSSKTSDAVSAPPDLVCVGWTWRDWGGRHPGWRSVIPQRPTVRNSTCKQDRAHPLKRPLRL